MNRDRGPESLAGYFLVADLDLLDGNFRKAVVLLLDHTEEGAFGLVVNNPLGATLSDAMPEMEELGKKTPLFSGGPVERKAVFALHSGLPPDYISPHARSALPGVWFEPAFESVKQYLTSQEEGPSGEAPILRIFLGYAGWGPGQLEEELREGAWTYVPAKDALLFRMPPDQLWLACMRRRGGLYRVFAETGFKPSLN